MVNKAGDFLIAIVFVAGIFVLVRPKSQGPRMVEVLTAGTTNLIKAATGGGSWNG